MQKGLEGVDQPLVKALLILNAEGKRVCSRFCDRKIFPGLTEEKAFEEALAKKVTVASDGFEAMEDVFEFGDFIVVFKQIDDLLFFVAGIASENEVVLADVLNTLDESLMMLLHNQVYEENVLKNLKSVLLIVDELVDQEGIIMETSASELVQRIGQSAHFADGIPLGEQTLTQALQTARDQITRSILS
eukprot:Plantae.Rhodophyta-Rhodochaete_pulchella.ctg9431.p2 GENE.Plantae.Rhodophyta-Rhodochaete_pulchella.ctg9431~~Plantae.Rhodophyta-Rhodochaete_pulchella.ctg9431.p2  ORF type:complete len:212 (+),score=49.82 Plantae.Rhodophyta-Rhodochaete_pulchella.ctg9431:70-636(+)